MKYMGRLNSYPNRTKANITQPEYGILLQEFVFDDYYLIKSIEFYSNDNGTLMIQVYMFCLLCYS